MVFCIYDSDMQDDSASRLTAETRELLAWLAGRVRQRQLSQLQIASASGVDQSQVSRILSGKSKRASPNLLRVCKYAATVRAAAPETPPRPIAASAQLTDAVLRVWDGSPAHAGALVDLLEAVERVQRTRGRETR